jgi:predicted O-methyltransferase YrrM
MERAFNGDLFAHKRVQQLIKDFGIQTFVETGTYKGETTKEICKEVPRVIAIEISDEYLEKTRDSVNSVGAQNVEIVKGDSAKWMAEELGKRDLGPTLFFLDAHWYNYWPIRDELQAIVNSGKHANSVIMIHDFKNPDNPEMQYDEYQGKALDHEYIKDILQQLWPEGYTVEYNMEASTIKPKWGKRGIAYFYRKT